MMFFFEFNTRFRLKAKIRRSAVNLNITMRYIQEAKYRSEAALFKPYGKF